MGGVKGRFSREEFVALWNNASSLNETVKQTGYTKGSACAKATQLRREGYNLKRWRQSKPGNHHYDHVAKKLSAEFLQTHSNKSIVWVSENTGFDRKTVARHARKHGVTFAAVKKARVFEYDDCLKDYIDGLLLSDGSLVKRSSGLRKSYHQVSVNLDWLEEIRDIFEDADIECRWDKPRIPSKGRPQHQLNTLTYLTWMDFADRWYPSDKKRIPRDLEITPFLLRNMLLGDGTFSGVLIVCLEGFLDEDVEWFAAKLRVLFPSAKTSRVKAGLRVKILVKDRNSFYDYIGAVPDSFQYKIVRSSKY